MTAPPLPEQVELHRDRLWLRDEDLRIESAVDAERLIEDVGFAKLRSLPSPLPVGEGPADADRYPSHPSIVPTSRLAVGSAILLRRPFDLAGSV